MSNVLQKLTEGIVSRNVAKEGEALLNKWSNTGLLEGLEGDHEKQSMACLLENQAKELLREANTMKGGSAEGFASVAFPIVRRVFGGLLANDIVSVQPMSLPSGLIFFLDFKRTDIHDQFNTAGPNQSVHGGGKVASGVADGVTDILENGFYALTQGGSAPRGACSVSVGNASSPTIAVTDSDGDDLTAAEAVACDYDPDIMASEKRYTFATWAAPTTNSGNCAQLTGTKIGNGGVAANNTDQIVQEALRSLDFLGLGTGYSLVRRHTRGTFAAGVCTEIQFVVEHASAAWNPFTHPSPTFEATFQIDDNFTTATATGGVVGTTAWQFEDRAMPEIDIKVDSVAITAATRKLKAKWTPELGQDLNAYHNLDAEVELTSILSEQIALEIDKEILGDLLGGATSTRYWSKTPGKKAGSDGSLTTIDFTGNVSEWYETLVETINDASADIHRKTLRGGANFVVCGPEVANILEFTSGFRASVTHDADRGTVGGVKEGALNKKWDVYVDPYFPRNAVLVGRKGSSFLESGYVYAPYVPLQTTPTIFDPDTLTPRKGVMTRYGKKMVRADMYGVVVVRDM